MNKLYGSLIIFFYFIKYPLVIALPVYYGYLQGANNWILNILFVICCALILKDWISKTKK